MKSDFNSKEEFLFNEIVSSSFIAGVGRHNVYLRGDSQTPRQPWRNRVKDELRRQLLIKQSAEHVERIAEFVTSVSDATLLRDGKLPFGVAQKVLNLFLKYAWALGWVEEPPDCPVDRRILADIGGGFSFAWGKMTRGQYQEVMSKIDVVRRNLSRAKWELETFDRLRPKS